ncbi:MAG: restriction endonuclease [Exilispira sp.]
MSLVVVITIVIILIIFSIIFVLLKFLKKRVLLSKAESELLKGEDKIAENRLTEVLKEEPENWEAIKNLSLLYIKNKHYNQALQYLEKALSLPSALQNWKQDEILFLAGLCSKNLKKYNQALKYLLTANGLNPNDIEVLKLLSLVYHYLGQYEKADIFFKKCYSMKDNAKFDKEFVKVFAINSYILTKFTETQKILSTYIEKFPNDLEAIAYYGLTLYKLGSKDESIKFLKIAVQYPQLRAEILFTLAEYYFSRQDLNQAYAFYIKASQTRNCPKDIYLASLYQIAQINVNANKINEAVVFWDKIYNIDPKYKDVSEKINTFSSLTSDERIRQFSLSNQKDATDLCKKMIANILGQYNLLETESIDDKTLDFLVSKSKGSKVILLLFRFIRSTDKIGEIVVKEFHLKMKEKQAVKGYLFSIAVLSESARDFIALRPIEYFDRSEISRLLKDILN